jgi:hypothetical protein
MNPFRVFDKFALQKRIDTGTEQPRMENPTQTPAAPQDAVVQFLKHQEVDKLSKHLQILQKTYDDAITSIESFHGDNSPLVANSILLALRNQVSSLPLLNEHEKQNKAVMSEVQAIKHDISDFEALLLRLIALDAVHPAPSSALARSQSDSTPRIKQGKKEHDRRFHLAWVRLCCRSCRKNLRLKRIDAVQVISDLAVVDTHLMSGTEEQAERILEDYFGSTAAAVGPFNGLASMAHHTMWI